MKTRLAGFALASLFVVAAPAAAVTTDCDRACLETLADRYVDALVARDPTRLPLAETIRFTENGQDMPIGEALWRTASAKGKYRLVVADVETGQIGYMGTIIENGVPAILSFRLKQVGGRITEVEQMVNRSAERAERVQAQSLDPIYLAPVPVAKRMSRDELIRIANLYFETVEDGKASVNAPFAVDCERVENGRKTTNNPTMAAQERAKGQYSNADQSCAAQFQSGFYKFVTGARERRFPIVDLERQIVYSFVFFDHRGDLHEIKLNDGTVVPMGLKTPFTWHMAELFRIEDGKIRRIEAQLYQAPYKMKSGW